METKTIEELEIELKYYIDNNDWSYISKVQLTEDFIRKYQDKVYWYYICIYQKLSENFIREFQYKVNWGNITQYQELSESFIREFKDKVCWYWVCENQILSESFIREFIDKVNWYVISKFQVLSEDFIIEFKDKVYWDNILKYQTLSDKFRNDYKNNNLNKSPIKTTISISIDEIKLYIENGILPKDENIVPIFDDIEYIKSLDKSTLSMILTNYILNEHIKADHENREEIYKLYDELFNGKSQVGLIRLLFTINKHNIDNNLKININRILTATHKFYNYKLLLRIVFYLYDYLDNETFESIAKIMIDNKNEISNNILSECIDIYDKAEVYAPTISHQLIEINSKNLNDNIKKLYTFLISKSVIKFDDISKYVKEKDKPIDTLTFNSTNESKMKKTLLSIYKDINNH